MTRELLLIGLAMIILALYVRATLHEVRDRKRDREENKAACRRAVAE